MILRKAKENEYETVREFYHSMIDHMKDAEYKPMWEKDVYPAPEFLRQSIQNEELYIGLLNNEVFLKHLI